jgi:hypothetical protein
MGSRSHRSSSSKARRGSGALVDDGIGDLQIDAKPQSSKQQGPAAVQQVDDSASEGADVTKAQELGSPQQEEGAVGVAPEE